jgi:hypothetical protein
MRRSGCRDEGQRLNSLGSSATCSRPRRLTRRPLAQLSIPCPPSPAPTLFRLARSLARHGRHPGSTARAAQKDPRASHRHWRPQKDLRNVSLVARAWRHPSQSLLLYLMDLKRMDWTLCAKALHSNAGCTLRTVVVDWHNARNFLGALQEHDISVETLLVYDARDSDLCMSTMSLKLLSGAFQALRRERLSLTAPRTPGLRSLWVVGHFQGHPPSRQTPNLSSPSSPSTPTSCPLSPSSTRSSPRRPS